MNGPLPELNTDRLVLEPLRIEHALEMVGVLGDDGLYEFTGGSPPSLETMTDQYEFQVAGSPIPGEKWFNWIIRLNSDRTAVGYVQATVNSKETDIAWVVGVPWQGQRLGAEAAAAMVVWLRAQGVSTFTAHIHASHRASQSVARSLGLERTDEVDEEAEEVWLLNTERAVD